jgi:hypothetical protein
VVETVDLFGGANFPDTAKFDLAHKLVVRAMELNRNGNLNGSRAFLVNAAVLARQGAMELHEYMDDTQVGGERILPVLKLARTAGYVADAALAVTGIAAVARGGIALAAGEGGTGAAALSTDTDIAAKQLVDQYTAEQGIYANELKGIEAVKQPPGSTGGFVKGKHSSGAGQGFGSW